MAPSTPLSLTDRALGAALGLLVLGVALGLAMRMSYVFPSWRLISVEAIHAHSHVLYWGWAGLALFALFFERVSVSGRPLKWVLSALFVQAAVAFFVLWRFGYARPGVVVSASTVVPFGAAVAVFWRASGGLKSPDIPFLRRAVVYVVLAYVCAMARVVLKATHLETPLLSALAVHLFLGAFGGFFVLGLLGLTVRALGVTRPSTTLFLVLDGSAVLLPWPTLLVVPGLGDTAWGEFARVAALAMLVPAAFWLHWVWKKSARLSERWLWRSTAAAWALQCALLASVALGLFPTLAFQRHAVVAVVHVQTLAMVTASLLLLIEKRRVQPSWHSLWLHQVAVGTMVLGLAAAALWPGAWGMALAALGGLGTASAQGWCAWRHWRVTMKRAEMGAVQFQGVLGP